MGQGFKIENGNTYVIASRNVITEKSVSGMRKQITEFFNKLIDKNGSIDVETFDGDVLRITKGETAKKARDNYKEIKGQRKKLSENEFFVKLKVESHIDEIVETSQKDNSRSDEKEHSFAKDGFIYRTAYFEDFDGSYYKITLSIGKNNGICTVYNVGQIKKDKLPSAKLIAVMRSKPRGNSSFNSSIPTSSENVKENSEKTENSNEKEDFRYQTRDTSFAREIKKNNESTVAVKDIEEAIEEIRNIYEDYSLTVDERRTKALKEAGILANGIVGEKKSDDDTQSAVNTFI